MFASLAGQAGNPDKQNPRPAGASLRRQPYVRFAYQAGGQVQRIPLPSALCPFPET